MSLFEQLADRVSQYQQQLKKGRYPFLATETSGLSRAWVLKQHADGCRPVKAQASIAMDKSPPPLDDEPPEPAPSRTSAPPGTGNTPPATAQKSRSSQVDDDDDDEEDCPPPFDMLDLPKGMAAMGFKYAAYCARRWFNGRAHVIPDKSDTMFDEAFVDTDNLKLSWVLGFGDVRKHYNWLLDSELESTAHENIYNSPARKELVNKFERFMKRYDYQYTGTLDTLANCDNDKQLLHKRFQFQHADVPMLDVIANLKTAYQGVGMNDLAAAIGNFSLYAAIASAEIRVARYNRYDPVPWRQCLHATVTITHVYVYARDYYSFNDAGHSVSQYLGHWNHRGVIIALDGAIADVISKKLASKRRFELANDARYYLPSIPDHIDKPVDIKSQLRKGNVYYPIRNRDFRRWRELKIRGGDFVIYSDLKRIKLTKPIVVDLGEVCWEYER
ncbi:hypothetical protein FNL37_2580 [Methylovorus glucosotrophus]|nr:hypothetical protein FNL37_2580 [Methylovorus glucosotrophus]